MTGNPCIKYPDPLHTSHVTYPCWESTLESSSVEDPPSGMLQSSSSFPLHKSLVTQSCWWSILESRFAEELPLEVPSG